MTAGTNAGVVQGLIDAFNRQDYDALDELVATDVVIHNAGGQGLDGMKEDFRGFFESFPDATSVLEDLVDMGDTTVFRDVCSGTNTGPFYGGPPTGQHVDILEVTAVRIEDGKIAEAWYFHDNASIMRQLGMAPAEEPVG
jgi:steroid delta-isomerase-like uncharacterized protein